MASRVQKIYFAFLLLLLGYTQQLYGLRLICSGLSQRRSQNGVELDRCSRTPLASSINDFGAALTNALDDTGNIFISAFSIYTALAMTHLGARGRTAQQIEDAFRLQSKGIDNSQFHNMMRDVLQTIREGHEEYNVSVANGLFVQRNCSVNATYADNVQNLYHGAVETVDFIYEGEAAKDKINAFVSEYTNNQIPEFLESPPSAATRMALLNAVYFKGKWEKAFPASREISFQIMENEYKRVPFMTLQKVTFRYEKDYVLKYEFVELPYKGGDIVMLLALPFSFSEFPSLRMNSRLLCRIRSSLQEESFLQLSMPKFRLKYRKELIESLKRLGIRDLFGDLANLSGIVEGDGLKVDQVTQEAVIEVNERGSEASAVTMVLAVSRKGGAPPQGIRFIADRPFLFYIVDNRNGLILFSGRVSDP